MSIIIGGVREEVPGLKTTCWLDQRTGEDSGQPTIKYVTHKNNRTRQIRAIVVHTHEGILGSLLPGVGPNTTVDEALARYQVTTTRAVSYDYVVDQNGDVICQNDPLAHFTWQATNVNPYTLGIEMVQCVPSGNLYAYQIEKCALLLDYLTARLGIQRQIPYIGENMTFPGIIRRLRPPTERDGTDGTDVVGIYAHCNQTNQRGPGDPGPHIFKQLKASGYMGFDYNTNQDKAYWRNIQQNTLGFVGRDIDGTPLKNTVGALKSKGYKHGLLVKRPLDDLLAERR